HGFRLLKALLLKSLFNDLNLPPPVPKGDDDEAVASQSQSLGISILNIPFPT
ncbi:hypothetical protein A2U01_0078212, partial [Trifolium medium]|nr:hypothetical protein [Trifolium medium]